MSLNIRPISICVSFVGHRPLRIGGPHAPAVAASRGRRPHRQSPRPDSALADLPHRSPSHAGHPRHWILRPPDLGEREAPTSPVRHPAPVLLPIELPPRLLQFGLRGGGGTHGASIDTPATASPSAVPAGTPARRI